MGSEMCIRDRYRDLRANLRAKWGKHQRQPQLLLCNASRTSPDGKHQRQPQLLLCNASRTSLNGLPNELLHMIFTDLPPHSQLSFRQSSRWLYAPFKSPPLSWSERSAFARLVRRDIFHKAIAEGPSERQLLLGLSPCLECRTMHKQKAFSPQQMSLPFQGRHCLLYTSDAADE